jgi:hypothetical protein
MCPCAAAVLRVASWRARTRRCRGGRAAGAPKNSEPLWRPAARTLPRIDARRSPGRRDTHEIRHHTTLSSGRRLDPPEGKLRGTDFPRKFRPDTRCWQLPDPDIFAASHPELAARLCALAGAEDAEDAYEHLVETVGAESLLSSGHFGGHHRSLDEILTPLCTICGAQCSLVVQYAGVSRCHSLWACSEHPASSFYLAHH